MELIEPNVVVGNVSAGVKKLLEHIENVENIEHIENREHITHTDNIHHE